jgi:hypothetical protein
MLTLLINSNLKSVVLKAGSLLIIAYTVSLSYIIISSVFVSSNPIFADPNHLSGIAIRKWEEQAQAGMIHL